MGKAQVAVLKTRPATVFEDYGKLMRMAGYRQVIDPKNQLLLKLNLSWTKYFPSCSSQPWQLEGVLRTLLEDGFDRPRIVPLENRTVVTDPWKGAQNNRWLPVLSAYGIDFTALPEVEWVVHRFKGKLLRLNELFPEGIQIPKMYIGNSILHLPTLKTHGHSITTGSVKNAFGGLLKEVRHYCHKYIHEVLADLMVMQREIHPSVFTVMDGTVAGNGAGPRTMVPMVKNFLLAGSDAVCVGRFARNACRLIIQFMNQRRHSVIAHRRGIGIESIRFDNIGTRIEVGVVYLPDNLWLRKRQQIVVALEVTGPVLKAFAAIIALGQPARLNHRSHRTIQHQYALSQRLLE